MACEAGGAPTPQAKPLVDAPSYDTNDPVKRACGLEKEWLVRIWRGYHGSRSENITMVHAKPNFPGAIEQPSHSGPWDYLQKVPLVLYGPKRINAAGAPLTRPAGLVDVFPTAGELLDVDLPDRTGTVLGDALKEGAPQGPPKLMVSIVWDGAGRNVLERWPDRWPNLARLEREGTSYLNASIGSSPSITPATHSTLGTGAYPRAHGATAIRYRKADGTVGEAFWAGNPSFLKMTTFADITDQAYGNQSRVGIVAWKSWHLGMLGHGTLTPGGDADHAAIIGKSEGDIGANQSFYLTPPYLPELTGLAEHAESLDRSDGEADGEWLGHDPLEQHDNPAWVEYETDVLLKLLDEEGYGQDAVPDLLFTNYKMTDIVGHEYTMDSPEMAEVLEAQDDALGAIVDYLDREVGDYVLLVTADHGHVPSAGRSGGWAVGNGRVIEDIDEHFEVPDGQSLVIDSGSTGLYFDFELMEEMSVTVPDVAEYLNGYTIRDNFGGGGPLPEGYEGRGDDPVFAATFARKQMPEIMECAFGSTRPPRGTDA